MFRVNPAAVVLLVVGFVAAVVGVKGTQSGVGQLLTGRAGAANPLGPATNASNVNTPAFTQPGAAFGGRKEPAPGPIKTPLGTIAPGTPLPAIGPYPVMGP